RLSHGLAEQLAVHRVGDLAARVVGLLQIEAAERTEFAHAPVEEDVRRGDVVDLLVERGGAVHDRLRGAHVGAGDDSTPDGLDVHLRLGVDLLHDGAANGHVFDPVGGVTGGRALRVLPAAFGVPLGFVPVGEAAGHAAGGRLAPTQAGLVEGADGDDVGRV